MGDFKETLRKLSELRRDPVRISFQGELGAFSQEALEKFGEYYRIDFEVVPTKDLDALFLSILNDTKLGIVPLENSSSGIVYRAMDIFLERNIRIIGEHYLPVNHCFMGWKRDNVDLEGRIVFSQLPAIEQCRRFIKKNRLIAQVFDDTAGAARYVAEMEGEKRYDHFAIASGRAAEEYGLHIFNKNIQDNPTNTTRFLIVRPENEVSSVEDSISGRGYKATISYSILPSHQWKIGRIIAEAGFKTHTLNTRPTLRGDPMRVFKRVFYSDIGFPYPEKDYELNLLESKKDFEKLIEAIKEEADNVRVLGVYPKGKIKNLY